MKYLNPEDKILEIGGNIGRNSLIIASILNNDTNLTVLESYSNSYKVLNNNKMSNNMNFNICNAALSNYSIIQRGWDTYKSDIVYDGFTKVNTIKLNELYNLFNTEYNVLILDCEGAFYDILIDFPEILKNINKILIENDFKKVEHKQYVDKLLLENNFVSIFTDYHPDNKNINNFYEVFIKN